MIFLQNVLDAGDPNGIRAIMGSAEWCVIIVSCPHSGALAHGPAQGRPVERVQSAHYVCLIGKEFNYTK